MTVDNIRKQIENAQYVKNLAYLICSLRDKKQNNEIVTFNITKQSSTSVACEYTNPDITFDHTSNKITQRDLEIDCVNN